jgi:hypothetical protein
MAPKPRPDRPSVYADEDIDRPLIEGYSEDLVRLALALDEPRKLPRADT